MNKLKEVERRLDNILGWCKEVEYQLSTNSQNNTKNIMNYYVTNQLKNTIKFINEEITDHVVTFYTSKVILKEYTIKAIKDVRQLYFISLSDSKKYVDKLKECLNILSPQDVHDLQDYIAVLENLLNINFDFNAVPFK